MDSFCYGVFLAACAGLVAMNPLESVGITLAAQGAAMLFVWLLGRAGRPPPFGLYARTDRGGPLPEVDPCSDDWSNNTTVEVMAAMFCYGWAKPRLYPASVILREWLELLPTPAACGLPARQPLPLDASEADMEKEPDRVMATLCVHGLSRLPGFLFGPKFPQELEAQLQRMNEIQAIAGTLIRAMEATDRDYRWKAEQVAWVKSRIARMRTNE